MSPRQHAAGRRWLGGSAGLLLAVIVVVASCSSPPVGNGADNGGDRAAPADIPPDGPITLALVGDLSFQHPFDSRAPEVRALADLLGGATVAFANLEVNLLDADRAAAAEARPAPRWVHGASAQARDLRAFGLDLVSLANNHATDFGADGLAATIQALDAAGILHAGAGADLAAARTSAIAGTGTRRVALVAIAASVRPEGRASPSQEAIKGRPGANTLAYEADITADGPTFETLKQAVRQLDAGPPPSDGELVMFGTRIRKGAQTRVEFAVNDADRQALLEAVRAARAQAAIVVVSVHSHEPLNASDEPAEFLRRVARDAVEAGASVVVGHGPHRLRGMEVYKGAPIFYSLGNFLYQEDGLDFRAADAFDAGRDLYGNILGTPTLGTPPERQLDDQQWWQGSMAQLVFGAGGLETVRIYPVDLGAGRPIGQRGVPRLATGEAASAILRRFAGISGATGAAMVPRDGGAVLELAISEFR